MKKIYSAAMLAFVLVLGQVSYAYAITLPSPEVSDWPEPVDPEPQPEPETPVDPAPEEPTDPVDPVDPTPEPEQPAPQPVNPIKQGNGNDRRDATPTKEAQHWTGVCELRADGKIYVHTAFLRNPEIAARQCREHLKNKQ